MGQITKTGEAGAKDYNKMAVSRALFRAQISGKGCKSLRQLPRAIYCRLQFSSQNVAPLCMDLESALVANHVESCQRVISSLAHCISEFNAPHHQLNREAFVLFGGDMLLLRALFCPFSSDSNVDNSLSTKVLNVRRECLSVLRELCLTLPFFTESLAAHQDFVIKLFAMMGNYTTFDHAVGLAEEVLAAREDTLKVQDIPDFANLVHHFSSRQLASFCRVLAMVLFEPEAGNAWMGRVELGQERSAENGAQLQNARPEEPEEPEWTVADMNHDAVLLIPEILARLLKLLMSDKVSFSREAVLSSEVSEFAATMSMEGSALENMYYAVNESRGQLLEDSRTISSFLESREALEPAPQLHQRGAGVSLIDEGFWNITFLDRTGLSTGIIHLTTHQVEVLFVLCALCGGKKREQVQNSLANLGLVDVLTTMFDKLDWFASQPRPDSRGIHGLGCACNPKSALKIQYLRLIHNFCDRDSCNRANKQLLLLPPTFPVKDSSSWLGNTNAEQESDGLMGKILKILVNEPADSLYRFWLASCVEAFLRGADLKDQEFVASRGLMEHLIDEILKGGFRCATSLQINFDLLGELIKFNKGLFQHLNKFLAGDKFDQFVEVLVTNLVDSNVFVRSVVLSMDYFKRCEQVDYRCLVLASGVCSTERRANMSSEGYMVDRMSPIHTGQDEDYCKITAFVSHNTLRLLRELMCAVRLSEINQDNICVLNTALIFFIFAERNGELQNYLLALRATDMRVLQTFRALLDFWQSYYLRKRGRECVSLHYSTQLPFSDWLQIVELLCSHPDSPSSLLYSSSAVAQCVALAASSEPPPRRR